MKRNYDESYPLSILLIGFFSSVDTLACFLLLYDEMRLKIDMLLTFDLLFLRNLSFFLLNFYKCIQNDVQGEEFLRYIPIWGGPRFLFSDGTVVLDWVTLVWFPDAEEIVFMVDDRTAWRNSANSLSSASLIRFIFLCSMASNCARYSLSSSCNVDEGARKLLPYDNN